VDAIEIDLGPLVQGVLREDLIHHGFDVELQHDLMNHRVPANLHDVAANLVLMVFLVHHQKVDALLSEQDALLALNCLPVVKVWMGAGFSLPSYFLLHAF
jgi:hypothetical protein